jgi:hypothetical protein
MDNPTKARLIALGKSVTYLRILEAEIRKN